MFSPIVGSMTDVSSAGTGIAMKAAVLLAATLFIGISGWFGHGVF